jgi:hypothetical protein
MTHESMTSQDLFNLIIAICAMVAALAALVTSGIGLFRGIRRLDHLHVMMNSRLTQLLQAVSKSRYAEGREDERAGKPPTHGDFR